MENKKLGPYCGYCGKSLKGYSWADAYTHMKEAHNISILDLEENNEKKILCN